MGISVKNPNAAPAGSPVTAQDKTDLAAVLAANPGRAVMTYSEIRAGLAAGKRARFTDGHIEQTAVESGLAVVRE